ncbi:hypothetical protein C4Y63_015275 [Klebsiella pneumoniae subsp. pneumoniae]|nr:hypothetical protein [Klebsiella pneumoniae]ROG11370.1 hypothetical protein C4Y63_015275 [Klebsiella pneumoniae subsp. pneumoniae]VVL14183.1 Uncharacterised protein [Klebsiella pneumoniae]
MNKRSIKKDKCELYNQLCEDDFLSPLVYAGEIIIHKKDDYSFAIHKRTGVIIRFKTIAKSNNKISQITILESGCISYIMKELSTEEMAIGISKYRDLILLLNRILQGTEMIQTEDNINQFRNCTAVVLSILYQNFPNPVEIDTFFIEGEGLKKEKRVLVNYDDEVSSWNKNGHTSENNPVKETIIVYKNTIKFLYDEGYIRCSELDLGSGLRKFYDCVLTSKGLAALGKIDVERKVSWGEKIHTALKDGQYKVVQDIAQKFIIEVLLR